MFEAIHASSSVLENGIHLLVSTGKLGRLGQNAAQAHQLEFQSLNALSLR